MHLQFIATSPFALGVYLKSIRKNKKLNQTQAGAKIGLEQATVSAIENGSLGTKLDTLYRYLSALELELVVRPRDFEINPHLPKTGDRW
ncbi:MAG: helix-turn-helix domain-containing protein [Gammaproteobacteria bacterium]